jgi:hypothetical protein
MFGGGKEAVGAGIFRIEGRLLLTNEIGLRRNPKSVPERLRAGHGLVGILSN